MVTFREWLLEVDAGSANDDSYAVKGVKSKWVGDQPPPVLGPVDIDPDDMYLTGKKRERRKKQQANPK